MIDRNKQWLLIILSWILPGIGHIYEGSTLVGICFLISYFISFSLIIISLILPEVGFIILILAILVNYMIIRIIASLDVYNRLSLKKPLCENVSKEYSDNKMPWLAFFLSFLLPGLGHAYLRKWRWLLIYLLLLLIISNSNFYALFLVTSIRILSCIHAYLDTFTVLKYKNFLTSFNEIFIVIVLYFIQYGILGVILLFALSPFTIITESMAPTLCVNDRVIINKLSYLNSNPMPGDIVLFTYPKDIDGYSGKNSIKRIAAISGETIFIDDNTLHVNGKSRCLIKSDRNSSNSNCSLPPWYLLFGIDSSYTVPDGHVFLLGDNRSHSSDSRFFGAVKNNAIKGKVTKIIWPPNRASSLCLD